MVREQRWNQEQAKLQEHKLLLVTDHQADLDLTAQLEAEIKQKGLELDEIAENQRVLDEQLKAAEVETEK